MQQLKTVLLAALEVLRYSYITGAHATCTALNSGIDSSKVATMCTDSVITGNSVYIDTTLAASMTLSAGPVCSCSVHSQLGKILNVTTYFAGTSSSSCDGTINYSSSGITGSSRNVSCHNDGFEVTSANMTVHFIKNQQPYMSKYCLSIDQVYCKETEYQCDDWTCIPISGRCNIFPDCSDHSDEKNCDSGICLENQVLCNDGVNCILPGQRCDGNMDCPDSSDEPATCGNNTTTSSTQSTVSPPVPMVTVTCTESMYSPTVDMTTGISTNNGKGDDSSDSSCSVVCIIIIVVSIVCGLLLVGAISVIIRQKLKETKVDADSVKS